MASALYEKGREHFARGDIHWKSGGDNFKIAFVDASDYTLNLGGHEFMNTDTIPAASKIATSGNLQNPTSGSGICDADDITVSSVSGDQFEYIIIFKDGGDGGSSGSGQNDLLIACIDTATGLPLTPNGGDVTVTWSSGANKIFKL